ncbi:MAG: hypothetical protein O3B47_02965, partial [bacterium]|nr:hypothetical protein [bacterium]
MQAKIDLFSKLLREMEAEIGTGDVAALVLKALVGTVKGFKAKTIDDFCEQFEELVKVISSTEPKFGILNYHFANLLAKFRSTISGRNFSGKNWKRIILNDIEEIRKEAKAHNKSLIEFSEKINVEGKTILIHDHSHTVQDVLIHYRRLGKHFRVVIAEQDFDKTHSNIERMHNAKIPFQVVPAYMLSHVHETIDMLFFGALTLKDTMDFVMDPGTHSTISELHVVKTPIYMFIDTTKFSLWKSRPRGEIFIHKHLRVHAAKPIEYERIKYSHDRVPSSFFHKIVTNKGLFTP